MDPQKIIELAKLLRNNGDKILNSEFKLTLSGVLLRALNDSFTLIADSTVELGAPLSSTAGPIFQVVKPINSKSLVFQDLQLIHDFVQKTTLLCIVHYAGDEYFEGKIDIGKFHALRRLEVNKTAIQQIVGIQRLRAQLQELICQRSLRCVDDIITQCGGDCSNGFVWNELKFADFSFNQLKTVDSSLEFAQFLQHLNLRHNQLHSVEAIKWLPHLKSLDLSFNRLNYIPQFHAEACKRLQSLNLSNNEVEDLLGIARLEALTELDLSDNCLLDHNSLLPLSTLLNLKFLNLYGNPLHCHPKHRLATAQFLHKNCSTVKFILDFEPLSKSEKALTGSQQLRHVGSLNRYTTRSTTVSINSGSLRLTPSSQTPASSVGSLTSFKFFESKMDSSIESLSSKKRNSKRRTVEIEDEPKHADEPNHDEEQSHQQSQQVEKHSPNEVMKEKQRDACETHLTAKQHIATLREKYGAEWLQSGNAQMMQSVLGIESTPSSSYTNNSRQLFNEFVGEFSESSGIPANNSQKNYTILTSTPTNNSYLAPNSSALQIMVSPIKSEEGSKNETFYTSVAQSDVTNGTVYKSLDNNTFKEETEESTKEMQTEGKTKEVEEEDEDEVHLKNIYSNSMDDESEVSETEDEEEVYIVYRDSQKESIFLTLSSNFIREKDTVTQSTKTKWSLDILESCERIKANTIVIHFDTMQSHKRERVYVVENDLCQDLEKKLRLIMSQRELSDMNQIIYRCVNCSCQFSQENRKYKRKNIDIRCPDCRSTFVAEIHNIPNSLNKSLAPALEEKLSPAAMAMEELTLSSQLIVKQNNKLTAPTDCPEDTNSIGSANSLNESSSCSKITSNSQSSFDSNQSVVGSSNTDRENEFKCDNGSDVDIISNPSQSSIEVLDQMQHSSRKTSEERRISHIPNLETIDDQSYSQSFIEREFGEFLQNRNLESEMLVKNGNIASNNMQLSQETKSSASASAPLASFNLTESSSSGSVTDSICTAYEQADKTLVNSSKSSQSMLEEEKSTHKNGANGDSLNVSKKEQGNSSMFGALFQSTNILMSSSKKLIDSEALKETSSCKPYKFNYVDFNDIDHRLKLHFYQTKFEVAGEHFKWLAKGYIYNATTQTVFEGLVVMSTCKLYLMEAFGPQLDDVTKWLRQVLCVSFERLQSIQLLPWKFGISLQLRDCGEYVLLLQDILRTDSLMLYFANNSLPDQCELLYQPASCITKRLNSSTTEQLKMCAILNTCEISCDNAKRKLKLCALLTTDTQLFLSSSNMGWLSSTSCEDNELELCLTQLMCNLVDIVRTTNTECVINFLDETQNKTALWNCSFETQENADSCLNAIAQSWEQLFGVPLFGT